MEKLTETTLQTYADLLDSDLPAPGGGSSGAYLGALGVSLARMYAHLSFEKKSYLSLPEENKAAFRMMFGELLVIKEQFMEAVNTDADYYDAVIHAYRLPKTTPEETKVRTEAVETALIAATEEPLRLSNLALKAMSCIMNMLPYGNRNVIADAYAGMQYLRTMIVCESYNIRSNANSLRNTDAAAQYLAESERLLEQSAHMIGTMTQGESK